MRKVKGARRRYRQGRNRANRILEQQVVQAALAGRAFVDDPNGNGYIYVLRLGINNLYKIGCTINVKKRMKTLMAANPNLTLVFAAKVTSRLAAEKALHTKFAEMRQAGELFDLSEDDLDSLANSFHDPGMAMNIDGLVVAPKDKLERGHRRCNQCGSDFVPEKEYWRLCSSCMKGSSNRTSGGWSRWRNLRTETHEYGKG
jgi:predicted GIY-YIG superfamily endonuclease